MGVLGVFVTAIYSGFVFSCNNLQTAREYLRATQILREKNETIRLYTWDQINSNGFIPAAFTNTYDPMGSNGSQGILYIGTVTFSNAPLSANYSNDLKQMTIRLNWTSSSGKSRASEMNTFVARNGLQTYVY